MSEQAGWRSYIEGPRFAKLERAIRNRVWADRALTLASIEREKGWIRETVRFEVVGPAEAVERFRDDVVASLRAHNEGGLLDE